MKLGIVYADLSLSTQRIIDSAIKKDIQIHLCKFSDFKATISQNHSNLYFGKQSVSDLEILLIRNIGKYTTHLELLLEYAKSHNIRVIDKGLFGVKEQSGSKLLTIYRLSKMGLPCIPTFTNIQSSNSVLVAKPIFGKQGEGVFLINKTNHKSLQTFGNNYFFQKYLHNDGDYRILVLGKSVLGCIKRTSQTGDFRHNVSLGARPEQVDLPKKVKQIAIDAVLTCGWEFAGVDLLQDKQTGYWYIIEVNRSPNFEGFEQATKLDVAGKLVEYIQK